MKTGIEVTAYASFKIHDNMIGTYLGRPAVHREVVETIQAAVNLKNQLLSQHQSIQVSTSTKGLRKPNGYDAQLYSMRGDNVWSAS